MFSFLEKVEAKYDKIFFDLSINDIDNKLVNLNEYKKIILLLSKCC